jgi:hypothetical protein
MTQPRVNPPKRKSNVRFATPDREWSSAKSKAFGCNVNILRLKWKEKDKDGKLVHNGEETVRIFAEDLAKGFVYFKKRMDQITDDELKKKYSLTRLMIDKDKSEHTEFFTKFHTQLNMDEKDGVFTCSGVLTHIGTKETIEVAGTIQYTNPFDARSDFFWEFNRKFPGSELQGGLLQEYEQKNKPVG